MHSPDFRQCLRLACLLGTVLIQRAHNSFSAELETMISILSPGKHSASLCVRYCYAAIFQFK